MVEFLPNSFCENCKKLIVSSLMAGPSFYLVFLKFPFGCKYKIRVYGALTEISVICTYINVKIANKLEYQNLQISQLYVAQL